MILNIFKNNKIIYQYIQNIILILIISNNWGIRIKDTSILNIKIKIL